MEFSETKNSESKRRQKKKTQEQEHRRLENKSNSCNINNLLNVSGQNIIKDRVRMNNKTGPNHMLFSRDGI